jgi:hypothetical protein
MVASVDRLRSSASDSAKSDMLLGNSSRVRPAGVDDALDAGLDRSSDRGGVLACPALRRRAEVPNIQGSHRGH